MKLILKIAAGVIIAVVALTVGCSALIATSVESSSPGSSSDVADALDDVLPGTNAERSAAQYLDSQGFSRIGLIKQLKYEGYTEAEAIQGVDAQNADWSEQAVRVAQNYLDSQAFSRSGLQQQLEYEGFTPAQASYGVSIAYTG